MKASAPKDEPEPEKPLLKVTVKTSPQAAESLTELLIQAGGEGGVEIAPLAEAAEDSPELALISYWQNDQKLKAKREEVLNFLEKLRRQGVPVGIGAVLIEPFIERGWERRWKLFFKPLRVGRLVVKPTWRRCKLGPEDIIIHIDPGMAFGTGGHATTIGCLAALEQLLEGGEKVLDLGTGSGILAIAAKKLGAREVLALDTDVQACQVAQENLAQNGIGEGVTVEVGGIEKAPGLFDLILANLHTEILLELLPAFKTRLAPQGNLILSGILESQGAYMKIAVERHGFCNYNLQTAEGWSTLWLKPSEEHG